MSTRTKIATMLFAVLLCTALAASQTAEARGRGRSSPYVKTPYGMIPKSIYNQGYVYNPQKLQQYRQREQQYMKQLQGGSKSSNNPGFGGPTTAAKKPTTAKK